MAFCITSTSFVSRWSSLVLLATSFITLDTNRSSACTCSCFFKASSALVLDSSVLRMSLLLTSKTLARYSTFSCKGTQRPPSPVSLLRFFVRGRAFISRNQHCVLCMFPFHSDSRYILNSDSGNERHPNFFLRENGGYPDFGMKSFAQWEHRI